jgi:hypothetical protein
VYLLGQVANKSAKIGATLLAGSMVQFHEMDFFKGLLTISSGSFQKILSTCGAEKLHVYCLMRIF